MCKEILPCPLCGQKADTITVYVKTNHVPLFKDDIEAPIVLVGCPTCGIPVSHTVDYWNNRPAEAALKAEIEQLKDFLEKILDRGYNTCECSDAIDDIIELALQALKRKQWKE
jgi:C4-type Zn-finger protein